MCERRPHPRCADDAGKALAQARAEFEAKHPYAPFPDILMDARKMASLDAEYAVARAQVRALNAELRDAKTAGADAGSIGELEARRDGALAQALAVRECLTGRTEARLATRREHLAAHGPQVVESEPAVPAIPEGFSPAGFDGIGRHYLTGGFRDPQGFDVHGRDLRGADRAGWLENGRHAETGTRHDPKGYGADGHHRAHGFDRLGYHRSTGTQYDRAGRTLADVEGRASEAVPAPASAPSLPTLHPKPAHLAVLTRDLAANDEVGTRDTAALVLGTDGAGVDALVAAGKLRVGDGGYRAGDLPALAGGAGEVRVDHARTTTAAPLETKGAVTTALTAVGSRWTVGQNGSDTPPQSVTVVRSSSTSVWVQPDGAPTGARPRWVKLDQAAWGVHPDGFDDVDTLESWRR